MLRKIIKYTLTGLGLLVFLIACFFAFTYWSVQKRNDKVYQVSIKPMAVVPDTAMLSQGTHLAIIKGCTECHGADLGGKVIVDDPALGYLAGPNLTKGKGGLPHDFSTQDWLRTLRHGLSRENRSLKMMPSHEFYTMNDQDIAAIIAYCQSVAPVDREISPSKLGPVGTVLTYFEKIHFYPAELIDHTFTPDTMQFSTVSAAYGKYLSVSCIGCHQANLKGGPSVIPGSPDAANITGSGNIGHWTEEQFMHTLRTGNTPDGKVLQNEFMPWQMTQEYTDTELKSLYAYLKSL